MKIPFLTSSWDRATWLGDDALLLSGRRLVAPGAVDATMQHEGTRARLTAHAYAGHRSDVPAPHPAHRVVLVCFPPTQQRRLPERLTLTESGKTVSLGRAQLQKILRDPASAASALGWLDGGQRNDLLSWLRETLAARKGLEGHYSTSLNALRNGLRQGLPQRPAVPGQPSCIALETVLRIDDRMFYLRGWAYATTPEFTLTAVSPEGERVEFRQRALWYSRHDVEAVFGSSLVKTGFLAVVQLKSASMAGAGWIVELGAPGGAGSETLPTNVRSMSRAALRQVILEDSRHDQQADFLVNHAHPALVRLQELDAIESALDASVEFGGVPRAPDISIIVPLDKQIDLVEQQLAQFVDDPELRQVELIYVLDSPESATDFRRLAGQLHELYRVPFRVVFLNRNVGLAGANNAAASLARGRWLLLLNSDVLPTATGWISAMRQFYEATPHIGALGVKLLFEDDRLQHAGLSFRRGHDGIWENQHFFKGLSRRFPPANVTRRVPAVSAACLMISRSLYEQCGGLRVGYVSGDYEDSDLCLRLLEQGYSNWYLADVELYHVEAQSYGGNDRQWASRYNAWLHTQYWGDKIEALAATSSDAESLPWNVPRPASTSTK